MLFQIVFIAYVRRILLAICLERAHASTARIRIAHRMQKNQIGVMSDRIGAEHVFTCVYDTEKQYKRIRSQSF